MNTRELLQQIRDEHGYLNPALVVEVARDPSHPLHNQVFDCSVEEASERYFVDRARRLLQVTYRPIAGKPTDLRAFVVTKGQETPTSDYVPTEEALTDPFTRELVLRQFKRDWLAFKKRWEHMREFAEVVSAASRDEAS